MVFGRPAVQITAHQPHPNTTVSSSQLLSASHIRVLLNAHEDTLLASAPCWGSKKPCNDIPSVSTKTLNVVSSQHAEQWELQGFAASTGSTWQSTQAFSVLRSTNPTWGFWGVLFFSPFPLSLPWGRVQQRQIQRNPPMSVLSSIPSILGSFSSLRIQNSQKRMITHLPIP